MNSFREIMMVHKIFKMSRNLVELNNKVGSNISCEHCKGML